MSVAQVTDYTRVAEYLSALFENYGAITEPRDQPPEKILGARITRDAYAMPAGRFTRLMDACADVISEYQFIVTRHPDLTKFLMSVAREQFYSRHGSRVLKEIRFDRDDVNDEYSDIRIVFVPNDHKGPLITYTCSVGRGGPQDSEWVLKRLREKLSYVYAT